jgi:cytochrome P450
VAITGLPRIAEFLKANEARLVVPPAPFDAIVPGGFVRYRSGASHLDVASALRAAFTPRVIDSCADLFREESVNALEAISSGASAPSAIDGMVFSSMLSSFLGIGRGAEFDRLSELFEQADYRALGDGGKDRAASALHLLIESMRAIALQANARPTFLSELVAAQPDALASDEILGNLAYALHTGRIDASGCLVWVIAMLGENPDWLRLQRADEASNSSEAAYRGGLADRIVRETLRLRQSEFLLRRTTADIELDGFVIPAGWHVRLCIAESHRSPDSFDNPDVFDPDRFLRAQGRSRYAPFGFAPHLCPGEHLTRALGRHFVVELARRYDVGVLKVEPWEFSGFHWRPNTGMRVHLSPARA